MGRLDGRVALVTGSSAGIGLAVAERLAREGALVVMNGTRDEARAAEAVERVRAAGGPGVEYRRFSVADRDQVAHHVKEIVAAHGALDILVNNAGVAIDGLLVRYKEDDWARTIDINLTGAFLCTKAAVRSMMRQRWGRIVNVTSVVGQMGNAGQAAYAASKAGLIGFTKAVARELASRDITVNAVAPGYIDTDMTRALPDEVRSGLTDLIPLGEVGSGDDVAAAVAYLCSDDARYVTGHVLAVNGGMWM